MLDVDVQLNAHGAVAPNGAYIITARSAVLKAWWRDILLLDSQHL